MSKNAVFTAILAAFLAGLVLGALKLLGVVTLPWWVPIVLLVPMLVSIAILLLSILNWLASGGR